MQFGSLLRFTVSVAQLGDQYVKENYNDHRHVSKKNEDSQPANRKTTTKKHLQPNPIKSGTFLIGAALTVQAGEWEKRQRAGNAGGALPFPFLPPPRVPLESPLGSLRGHSKVFWPRGQFQKFELVFSLDESGLLFPYGVIYDINRR